MDRRPFDRVLFRSDIPACSCSRMAARSPTAASKATSLHNRCVLLQESRVCAGDLGAEEKNDKASNEKPHRRFTIVQKNI